MIEKLEEYFMNYFKASKSEYKYLNRLHLTMLESL